MCCKVFVYESKEGNNLYLNGSDSSKNNPEIMLKLYVDWFNNDFAISENREKINIFDYKFIYSFCPIDFYDDSIQLISKLPRY